jgi:hypothetical protein
LIVDDPINVEILDAAHYGLDKVEDHFSFAIFISTQNSPELSQQSLLFLGASLYETET